MKHLAEKLWQQYTSWDRWVPTVVSGCYRRPKSETRLNFCLPVIDSHYYGIMQHMDKRQQPDLIDKVQRELDDLKNSQTSVLKKVSQIAAHNITLGVDLLDNKLPDLEEQVNATLTVTSDLSDAFAEYRTKFFPKTISPLRPTLPANLYYAANSHSGPGRKVEVVTSSSSSKKPRPFLSLFCATNFIIPPLRKGIGEDAFISGTFVNSQ